MAQSVLSEYLPDEDADASFMYTLPELHYPASLNSTDQLVDVHVREGHGDDVAIYHEDDAITYSELQARINRFGNVLLDLGVEMGDRVVVRFPNRPEAIVACLAVQKIGAVAIPSMKLLRAKELRYVIDNAEANTVVVYDALLDELDTALPDLPTVENVVVVDGDPVAHQYHDYDALLETANADLDAAPTDRDDLALMLYTSGTTGRPKGAVHTHRQLLASADSYARYCLDPSRADVFGGNPPLPFAYGFGCLVTFPFRFGASTSIVQDATPTDLLEAVEDHGVTVLCSIPTAFKQILSDHPDAGESYDLDSLRLATSAGEPLTETTFDRFEEQFGASILDGIGTTEMLHIFISHRLDDEIDPTATGFPVPGYECKVIDPDTGEELDRGESGLLAVRGPTGITYWNRPEKQAEAVRDGWSIPGDIYVQRPDGRFEYQSRKDDLIISSGYNIPGPEVEAALEEAEAVLDSAVIGKPDDTRGHIVKAYVVPLDISDYGPNLTEHLQEHVKETLAPYKYPREIEYVEELPRTETGKIRRKELREREQG